MLDQRHLIRGFDALCRAHRGNYFFDGHKGGALISATYFCREAKPEKGVAELLEARIDEAWGTLPLFAPFPEEDAEAALIEQARQKLVAQCCTLRQAAHNWILTSLALRVLDEIPELATPKRMAGLEALIGRFDTSTEVSGKQPIEVPHPKNAAAYSAFILEEFIATTKRFDGRGQGWSGHLCTFGRALLDLQQHGHADIVDEGRRVMEVYVRRVRSGPKTTDRERPEKRKGGPSPSSLAYWKKAGINFRLGHALKYPYGFAGLVAAVEDDELERRARETFWRISS